MATSIDQQFVEFVVKSLVGNPDAVKIDRRIDEKGVLLELTVDPEDLGRVIGKRGATAQSLRTLLRALGTKNEARYNLKIVDVDRLDEEGNPAPRPARSSSSSDDATDDDDDAVDEPKQSDSAARTRKELADLDDLDI
ncbi:KH domain-containing protein [Candidatus Saccharibacteria bacterium]|nr:MAG: KH domain-containing protein [Candidatus Saccharibacteria bacterium]